MVGGREDKQ